jgi:pimeloyl-ACP methyl ester carboxylesterase
MSEAAGSTRRDGGSETTRTSAAASTGAIRELETVVAECANGRRRVAYAEYGDPDGEAVVVLHGTPGSRLFGALFDDAARRGGVRVLAPDRPGYGRSSPWSDRRLTDTGAFVTSVLDDAGVDRAGVVGFSGGGPHALAVAASHGERVASVDVVSGATTPSLRDGTPTPRRLLGVAARRTPRLPGTLVRGRRWVAEWAGPSVVVSQYTNGERETAVDDGDAERVRRGFVEALARRRSGPVDRESSAGAGVGFVPDEVERPVRLWHGERDDNAPIDGVPRLADWLPAGRLVRLDGADHLGALLR